jgi:hypothetical protein
MGMRPNLKVLITTGYASDQDSGADEVTTNVPVMRKPYSRAELATQVRGALDS